MAISSIHFAAGHSGYFDHNSREAPTNNAIFSDEENYCSATKDEAFKLFRDELAIRSQAYTDRTGQKLQKSTNTHMSAIFNFNKDTTPEQAQAVCDYLEKVLDTKVVQLAMHRDEGHIIEDDNQDMHDSIKVDNAIKNYHGHIEMVGLDSQGYSIRKKLDKPMLREIQTEVAKILNMERGRETSYTKEEYVQITSHMLPKEQYADKKEYNRAFGYFAKELGLYKSKKAKRLDTYEYKEMAKQRAEAVKELQKELSNAKNQIQDLKNENSTLKKSNSSLKGQNTKLKKENEALKAENKDLKIDNEALKYSKKELENQIKDLGKNLRETLKDLGAVRADYAKLEQLNKDLKEELKNERLNQEKVIKSYQDLEKNLKEELTKKDEKIDTLEVENKDLKSALEALKYQLDLKEKRSQSYFGLNQELKNEIIALKEQINALEEQKEVLEEKVIDLEEKVNPRANMDDLSSTKQIKKEDYLTQIVNQYDSKKPNLNLVKAQERQERKSLLDKFQEVENKVEIENQVDEPTKKEATEEKDKSSIFL